MSIFYRWSDDSGQRFIKLAELGLCYIKCNRRFLREKEGNLKQIFMQAEV